MQLPLHSLNPALQTPAQAPLRHTAVPLVGARQGVQETPQLLAEAFETHTPLQTWKPALHVRAATVSSTTASGSVASPPHPRAAANPTASATRANVDRSMYRLLSLAALRARTGPSYASGNRGHSTDVTGL